MFPMFLLKDFEGEIASYFASWSMLIFIDAADRKILSLFPARLNTFSCSDNDSSRVGDVQPVEAYPWHTSRVLRHLVHLVSSRSYSRR